MKRLTLILVLGVSFSIVFSQGWKETHVKLSAMRPAFPFSKLLGVATTPFHPIVEVGAAYQWNKNEKNSWSQNVNIGFGYHRFLQSILPIYTTMEYKHCLKKKWQVGAFLGAGYLHSFPLNSQFKFVDGAYERTGRSGKAQVIIRMGLLVKYQRLSLAYENFLQAPFVRSYVPLMPYNLLTIGYHMPFQILSKKAKK